MSRTTTSPGTISWAGTKVCWPSRETSTVTCTCASRSSTAREALYSCQKLSNPLSTTMARMIAASVASPSTAETRVAKIRMSVIGLANWRNSTTSAVRWWCGASLPARRRRAAASVEVKPPGPLWSASKACSTESAQKGADRIVRPSQRCPGMGGTPLSPRSRHEYRVAAPVRKRECPDRVRVTVDSHVAGALSDQVVTRTVTRGNPVSSLPSARCFMSALHVNC